MVASQARPAYIYDTTLGDWVPMSGVVDTGQAYTFTANQTFNGLVTANNGINAATTLSLQTGGTSRLSIDSNGYIRMPNKTIISGQIGSSSSLLTTQKIPFDDFFVTQGGISYNSTTRRFTVSAAGIYRIAMNPFFQTGYSNCRVTIGINNDAPDNALGHRGMAYRDSATYDTVSLNSVVSLSANDYIVFYLNTGAIYNATSDRFNQFSIEMIA
jgi:hypothetical protein